MYSKYERQKDKRSYGQRQQLYTGPQYLYPAERIVPARTIQWGEDGLPSYVDLGGEGSGEGNPEATENDPEAAAAE